MIPPSIWGGLAVCFPEELWEPGLPRGKVSKCVGQEHGAGEDHNRCLELEEAFCTVAVVLSQWHLQCYCRAVVVFCGHSLTSACQAQ